MKNLSIPFLITVVMAVAIWACSDEKCPGEEGYVNINPRISRSDSRISGNRFEQGDAIGVYVVPYSADPGEPGDIATDDYAPNTELIYSGSSWLTHGGGRIPWPGVRDIDIYAYYPYDAGLSDGDPTAYRFSVKSDQSTLEGYIASDFLRARSLGIAPASTVPLIFYHGMGKVNINIKSELESLRDDIEQSVVTLLSVDPEAIIDLSQFWTSAVASGRRETDIFPHRLAVPVSGYDVSLTAIVVPQHLTAGAPLIRLTVRGINYTYTPDADMNFHPGTTVTYNITITRQGLAVTVESINEWYEGEEYTGNIGDPVPRVADLSAIDWSQSYIHNIYSGGVIVAQACREYLYKQNGPVNAQAVVVYPMNARGQPDITRGFVAQLMNRNRNPATNEYEPNPASVHGGSVGFNTGNTFGYYEEGALPPVTKILLGPDGKVSAAAGNAITTMTSSPDYLTDYDGNNYAKVKIGTQIWISENLKVEHYRDGSDLTYYYYNDNRQNKDILGALYNWNTVADARGIAPAGWRVPTQADFESLWQYLQPDAGMKMKANYMWSSLNNNDNVSGFSGLPAGRRTNTGTYNEINNYGQWWSSTGTGTNTAYRIYLSATTNAITADNLLAKSYTQSVRLLVEEY